ncbi:VraH family protein [Mammaliicoccus sciuri]|uniref:VraH family peptide resistance protein n=1 Tax=Mammaliicoccus sciuri TaxID=1296 RepID=UPI00197F7221|nr:VraH family protein [Mammaliicoccus sciuri]MBN4910306.1 VraH family protein [Staphylococcus sp. EG-SA-13]MCJ0919222.1 VraH family protein [Mammaliicoccus sciuri]MCJ0957006.1 VraH family protein [Mammaliicoccus sciuri]MCJ0961932.1 VraH family protein [Mammaliicoccus sciuri]MCJ1775750.1 VraH family protein [Mammaliicoccus sciuri]
MKVKELIKQSYDDLLELELTSYNIAVVLVAVVVLSVLITPLFGIPIGLLGGAYYLKNYK